MVQFLQLLPVNLRMPFDNISYYGHLARLFDCDYCFCLRISLACTLILIVIIKIARSIPLLDVTIQNHQLQVQH